LRDGYRAIAIPGPAASRGRKAAHSRGRAAPRMTVRRDRFTSPASIDSREQDRVRSSCFVLGLNGSNRVNIWDALPGWAGHDAAAVLLRDGQLIAAIEEERLDRIKHSHHFPVQAIKECLNLAGIGPEDLDIVALNIKGQSAEGHDPTDLRSSVSALFQAYIGDVRKAKSCFIDHQLAHLYSAYIPSGFEECLCLSLDSLGDGASGAIGHAHGGQIQILRRLVPKQSLGDLCCDLVRVLGYSRFDEYKVMALAALGRGSAHADLFSTMYKLLPDGKFELARDEERWRSIRNLDLVKPRSQGEPFSQSHFDFAAGLQDMAIKFVLHLLGHFCDHTGLSRLALAGGFAQNCAVNGRILYSGILTMCSFNRQRKMLGALWVPLSPHFAATALPRRIVMQRSPVMLLMCISVAPFRRGRTSEPIWRVGDRLSTLRVVMMRLTIQRKNLKRAGL
jgi:hypothetical protein